MVWDARCMSFTAFVQRTLAEHTRRGRRGSIRMIAKGAMPRSKAALDGIKDFHTEFRVILPGGEVRLSLTPTFCGLTTVHRFA